MCSCSDAESLSQNLDTCQLHAKPEHPQRRPGLHGDQQILLVCRQRAVGMALLLADEQPLELLQRLLKLAARHLWTGALVERSASETSLWEERGTVQ